MNEELNIPELLAKDVKGAIEVLTANCRNLKEVIDNREEYEDLRRDRRDTQLDNTQRNKELGNNKVSKQTRIPIPFQKKIVNTATAFEVGEPCTLTENQQNALTDEIKRLWRVERLDSKLLELIRIKKSETESALLFYTQKNADGLPEIKTTILESKDGNMIPCFDSKKDLIAFMWSYEVKFIGSDVGKKIKKTFIYDSVNVYYINNEAGTDTLIETKPHGFNKIPVVYLSQDKPEWYDVRYMIDRYETSLSRLADSNDYSGHPILKIYGKVKTMPEKTDNGKTLLFEQIKDNDGNFVHGDAEFLENGNATESVKLELDKLEKHIAYLSNTPQLSMEDLKGLGALSGVAIKLMFLDAIIKAKMNEGQNRSTVERIINVLISGVTTTTTTKLKSSVKDTYFDVKFNSIIPADIADEVSYLTQAVSGGIMSKETGVKKLGMVEDTDKELQLIENDSKTNNQTPKIIN